MRPPGLVQNGGGVATSILKGVLSSCDGIDGTVFPSATRQPQSAPMQKAIPSPTPSREIMKTFRSAKISYCERGPARPVVSSGVGAGMPAGGAGAAVTAGGLAAVFVVGRSATAQKPTPMASTIAAVAAIQIASLVRSGG
jgi:hypothetical protein